MTPYQQLESVIRFWEHFDYIPDRLKDVMIDLDLFLYFGGGDCEDFAEAGKTLLTAFGWKNVSVVGGNGHAVLEAYIGAEVYYLDSQTMLITREPPLPLIFRFLEDGERELWQTSSK